MTRAQSITTAEQLYNAGDIGRCELIRGELVMMSPANPEHARIVAQLSHALLTHLDQRPDTAEVWSGDPGFRLRSNPDTVRAPDIAVLRSQRLRHRQARGFFEGAPDLAIEILSPGDSAGDVLAKVNEWLVCGCAEVWVVDPDRKTIAIHVTGRPVRTLREGDDLTCDPRAPLLPGFRVPVAEIFR